MATQENASSAWNALLGREVRVVRDRYGYKMNGDYFRRVTTLLGGIPKPALTGWAARTVAEFAVEHKDSWTDLPPTDAVKLLKGAPWSQRDDAADRGSAVHAAVEAYLKDRPLPDGLTEDEFDCAVAVEAFLRQHVAKVLAVELTVISVTREYAGTLDLWALGRDGHTYILDWKTSGSVYVDHAVQLAAYANAEYAIASKRPAAQAGKEEVWNGTLIEWGPEKAQRLGIVHVRPDGATLHPVNYTSRLWHVFRAAAFTKRWQLDTDNHNRTPREHVFGETIDVSPRSPEASTATA
ncbi:MAG: hypothetical protein GEU90_17365 [Gemmatimonas sp.]|nr:hypothetical protein [Gemmatimonas sp.]